MKGHDYLFHHQRNILAEAQEDLIYSEYFSRSVGYKLEKEADSEW